MVEEVYLAFIQLYFYANHLSFLHGYDILSIYLFGTTTASVESVRTCNLASLYRQCTFLKHVKLAISSSNLLYIKWRFT